MVLVISFILNLLGMVILYGGLKLKNEDLMASCLFLFVGTLLCFSAIGLAVVG